MTEAKRWSAGMPVDDLCRACKELRTHTVIAAGTQGEILRVICDFCGSQHNFRGGGTVREVVRSDADRGTVRVREILRGDALPVVSERERIGPVMSVGDEVDLELLLRRIVREEAGVTPVVPADKWRGGSLVLKPGKPGLQDKVMPIDALFHKIVMIRNKLRVLEQQVNGLEVSDAEKLRLQAYITGCYGSLTTFNVLFAHEDDRFKGQGED